MNKIKPIIKKRKLSVSDAADQIGISRQHLYNAINGCVGKKTAIKISKWSGNTISVAELMGV